MGLSNSDRTLMRRSKVAARYGVTTRTVINWENSPTLGFPKAVIIRTYHYFREDELDAFDAARRATAPACPDDVMEVAPSL
jgi:hypothetical protein